MRFCTFDVLTEQTVARSFKISLLGDPRVGKTSLRKRYMGEGFRAEYLTTLGADFAMTQYKDSQLQIWDLAGHIDFHQLLDNYLIGARGLIVVYDITRPKTIDSTEYWIQRFIDLPNEMVPTILVGNKTDLRYSKNYTVDTNKAMQHAKYLSDVFGTKIQFIETSALKGENINEAFENLVDEIINQT